MFHFINVNTLNYVEVCEMTEEKKDKLTEEEKKNQPDLTGDEETVEAEEADYKANKVDEDDVEVKSPLKGKKAED